jgi:hypothetical protein
MASSADLPCCRRRSVSVDGRRLPDDEDEFTVEGLMPRRVDDAEHRWSKLIRMDVNAEALRTHRKNNNKCILLHTFLFTYWLPLR